MMLDDVVVEQFTGLCVDLSGALKNLQNLIKAFTGCSGYGTLRKNEGSGKIGGVRFSKLFFQRFPNRAIHA